MDRILRIEYGGVMQIDVNTFFPTGKRKILKLLKICEMDWDTDRVAELIRLLKDRISEDTCSEKVGEKLRSNVEVIEQWAAQHSY